MEFYSTKKKPPVHCQVFQSIYLPTDSPSDWNCVKSVMDMTMLGTTIPLVEEDGYQVYDIFFGVARTNKKVFLLFLSQMFRKNTRIK